jgi:hypothetical protein
LGLVQLAIPVLVVLGVIWLIRKATSSSHIEYTVEGQPPRISNTAWVGPSENQLREKIAAEIRAQHILYPGENEKKIVEQMAQTVEYFGLHPYEPLLENEPSKYIETAESTMQIPEQTEQALQTVEPAQIVQEYETPWKKLHVIDGAVILLYLGSFMLLAAIGLYIAIGGGTTIKALLAMLMTAGFYGAGTLLYRHSDRLKPVGATFIAIAMAILPMAGAAVYYYAFDQSYGPAVWLVTSIVAIGLYGHALYLLRSPLISYLIVFSSLSVVLASISSIGLATFYYIQGISTAGLIFVIVGRLFAGSGFGVKEAYDRSANFLIPFSMGLGALFVTQIGWLQLAYSLAVGALFYGYQTLVSDNNKSTYALLAQFSLIGALLSGTYGLRPDHTTLAATSIALSAVYACIWMAVARSSSLLSSYKVQVQIILLTLPLIAVASLLPTPEMVWIGVSAFLIASVLVYAYTKDSFSAAGIILSVLALPMLVGFVAMSPSAQSSQVGIWYLLIMTASVAVRVAAKRWMDERDITIQQLLLAGSLLFSAFMQVSSNDGVQIMIASIQLALLSIQAFREDDVPNWLSLAAVVQLLWVLAFLDNAEILVIYVAGCLRTTQ